MKTHNALCIALAMLAGIGCGEPASPRRPASIPNSDAPKRPTNPTDSAHDPVSSVRVIELGQTVSGGISPSDTTCTFVTVDAGWGGLCHVFIVRVHARGGLRITARWTADVPMALFARTATGEQLDLVCCNPPSMVMELAADSGSTYQIALAYIGRPPGYPAIQTLVYTLGTSLVPPDSQATGALEAIVFGDAGRSQRLARARLEVVDGSSHGRVAAFDDATGVYRIADLPAGYANILISADGFVPLAARVLVGANIARELVLQRRDALLDATHLLVGVAWANAARTSAYVGVKIEILDGPVGGVFTFTDDDFGMYAFGNLPPGPLRLRASSPQVQPETLSVVVSGNRTVLDFYLRPRNP